MGECEGLQGTLTAAAASQEMFTVLKSFLLSELNAFKEETKRQNDDSIHSAVKELTLHQSVGHFFKSKGNEGQFHHEEKVAGHIDDVRTNIIVRGQDCHSYNTRSKEIIRTTKSVTNWGLLRSFNSVLADWNDLLPTTKKLSLRDFKNTLRKTFMDI